MKRVLSIIMCVTIISLLLCSCGNKADGNKADENNELNYLSDETQDYKNFGFNSIYAEELMNVWIEVRGRIFVDDPENAYVIADGGYATMTFTSGFMKQERWDRGDDNPNIFYSPDREFGGYPWHSDQISIIDNNTVQLHNYRSSTTLTIIDRKMYGSVPIISCDFHMSYTEDASDGTYIPAYFIDWTRSPERITEVSSGSSFERKYVKYYIKSDFLD